MNINRFDTISPLDYRYCTKELLQKINPYLSERAAIAYMLKVEIALVKVLADKGICTAKTYKEIQSACEKVTVEEVSDEERRIRHYTRALVNCIRNKVSNEAKPFVHLTATSHDIICTADSLRFKECTENILIQDLMKLEKTLITIALREKDTLQIGRTHGQHAVPITFGFAIAEYVSRIGECILNIKSAAQNLRGKMSGAVGSYNASSLLFSDPEAFEKQVLSELGLKAATHSTQIVQPEFMLALLHQMIICYGVLANLSDDMRHLSRSEIAEIMEVIDSEQVGSSTMPHKKNPIDFENVKSMWKVMMPRIVTLYLDQISEHQRDLTNSASSRFTQEIIVGFLESVNRLQKQMERVRVNNAQLKKNFDMSRDKLIAEPLYILLASHGHSDAHEAVRKLIHEAENHGLNVYDTALRTFPRYMEKLPLEQREILKNPEKYRGIASQKTERICKYWSENIG